MAGEMNDELNEAINGMTAAMGAACELTGFLFQQLIKNGFTREEAMQMATKYLMGMISNRGKADNDEFT